jgi:hypothetical protein
VNDETPIQPLNPRASGALTGAARQDLGQQIVAALVRNPRDQVLRLIQALVPGDIASQAYRTQLTDLRRAAFSLMERITGGDFRRDSQQEPTFADRMRVSWELLFACDQVIKKLRPEDIPARPDSAWLSAALAGVIGEPIGQPLLGALMERLRLGTEGEFLSRYCAFLRRLKTTARQSGKSGTRAKHLTLPASQSGRNISEKDLRRLAWWFIRARRERYVEPVKEPPYIYVHFGFVVGEVHRQMIALCGADRIGGIDSRSIAEEEVNAWLRYGGLDIGETAGANNDQSFDAVRELVRAFSEANRLTQKLVVAAEERRSPTDPEIESQLRQYATENRNLEERIKVLELQLAASSNKGLLVESQERSPSAQGSSDLRELVRLIDAKYSLDLLKSIQLGSDSPVTLRSFVSHVLFALTKKGLISYPTEERFDLSYEQSGLYECDGFEVKPGETVSVTVVRRGWALQAKERLLPVRRARVECVGLRGQDE